MTVNDRQKLSVIWSSAALKFEGVRPEQQCLYFILLSLAVNDNVQQVAAVLQWKCMCNRFVFFSKDVLD